MGTYRIGMNGAIEMSCSLSEQIQIVDDLGYDYIEMRDGSGEGYLRDNDPGDLLALFAAARVKPLCVNAVMPVTLAPGADRERLVGQAEYCIQTAATIACPYVLACCYGCEPLPYEEGRRQVVEGLKLVADLAKPHGIEILYEPLGSKDYPIHTVEDTMWLLQEVGRDNVGWLLDVYHFHVVSDSLEALRRADIDKLGFVHISDVKDLPYERLTSLTERLLPGDGVCDLAGILRTICQAGYSGPFSLELANAEFSSWDPREFAAAAKQKVQAVLERHFH